MSYATTKDFQQARMGVQISDLETGVLQTFLDAAARACDQYCSRFFTQQDALVEVAEVTASGNAGHAVIGKNGVPILNLARAFPIRSVASVTWLLRPIGSIASVADIPFAQTNVVASGAIQIDVDEYGDGRRLRLWLDFGGYRSSTGAPLQFTVTYDGGYLASAYPTWLQRANMHVCAWLLKTRGSQSLILDSVTGQAIDWTSLSQDMKIARSLMDPHRRIV